MHYFRRKGYDSAMIYFKDVIRMYPDAPAARTAGIRLVDVYRLVRYREEASEQCTELARKYPGDREVRQACAAAGVTAATAPAPASAPGSAATRTP